MSNPRTSSGPDAPQGYTAAEIASASGLSKPTVLAKLLDTPAASVQIVRGQQASAWTIDSLPQDLRVAIGQHAARHGLSLADYMDSSARQWQPSIALSKVSDAARQKAVKLQHALATSLAHRRAGTLSRGEIERMGLDAYKAVFGFPISGKHWRALMRRTENRARWDDDFTRLEIYLDESAQAAASSLSAPLTDELRPLRALVEGILKLGEPTMQQKRQIFDAAFDLLDSLTAGNVTNGKRAILECLAAHAPFLAKNPAALRRNFDFLYQRWAAADGALASLDVQHKGRPRGPQLTEQERLTLIAYAKQYGGGRDQGWREAIRDKKLRSEVVAYYGKSLRKMPRKLREQLTGYVDDAKMRDHGQRHAVLQGPHINRNPDHPANPLAAGDVDQSDDMTFVNVVWDELPDGSLYVGQPQFLAWIDERSWFAYNFALILEKGYSAFNIRNSWTNKCDTYGLPRKSLYLEGSYWQTARVWVGRRDEVQWSETEQGIRRMGVRIHHALYPRGKVIERIYGKIQNDLQAQPGYVGRNPLTDRYEEVQKQLRLVKAGHVHPKEFGWLSKAQWSALLGELLVKYNLEPGEGKYLAGLSPKQAYERHFTTPLQKIPDNCRHLLACNKIEARITSNGLTFQYGKRRFNYKDERLGKMRFTDTRCIAWFNPEQPQTCGVTDLHGENPIVVKLETDVPNHDAPAELLRLAHSENAAMERHAKEIYRAVKMVWSQEFEQRRFRRIIADGTAAETGSEFRRQTEEIHATERAKTATVRKATRAARRLGVRLDAGNPRLDREARGLQLMDEAFGTGDRAPSAKEEKS